MQKEYITKLTCGFYFHILGIDEQLLYKVIGAAVAKRKETLQIKYIDKDMIWKVCNAIRYDNPEFFYWDMTASSIEGNLIILKYRFSNIQEILDTKKKLREVRENIEKSCFSGSETSTERLLGNLCRYLTQNVEYAYDELQKPKCTKWIYDVEGCLLKRRSVCLGIALAVEYMCRRMHITSILITGKAEVNGCGMSHAWNLVKIGDEFRHMDVTCEICEKKEQYHYFLLKDSDMQERVWRRDIYPSAG